MRSFVHSSLPVLLVAASACASANNAGRAAPSVTQEAASGALGPAMLQWSGRFRSVHQQLGEVTARAVNVASGTVLLTAPDDRQIRVQLKLSGAIQESRQLHWAIAPGSCRSGTIPLMPVNSFPEIRMSNGRGELDERIPVVLPTSGSYHVNIYMTDGTDESDVLTCTELKLERRS